VYGRELEGRTLTIRPSGWTYNNTFVLMDEETGSLWYPDRRGLKGIQGAHFKKRLKKLPSEDTTWKKWMDKHPGSRVLK
jgi:hypothetical protein